MTARRARCDVVVVGGGIAGLWTRAVLERNGLSTILVEREALGTGQSIASQGILHAGLKYVVSGEDDAAAGLLAAEHDRWIARLAGREWPDLRDVPVLAERVAMWSTPSLVSRATARLASPMMRSASKRLDGDQRPDAFRAAPKGVGVWDVDEPVIDARALIGAVAALSPSPMLCARSVSLSTESVGVLVTLDTDGAEIQLDTGAVVFAAGSGNAGLLRSIGVDPAGVCQDRPLHMLIAHNAPAPIFGHCIQPSSKPRLTITSAREGGAWVWYIGGAIAEPPGTERSPAEQIEFAKKELGACLSWLDLSGLRFETLPISRAEGLTPRGKRPEGPVVYQHGRALAVWPTKLAMAPVAADRVLERIEAMIEEPMPLEADDLAGLSPPTLGDPVWNRSQET